MQNRWKILLIVAALVIPSHVTWAAVTFHYRIIGLSSETLSNTDKRLKGKLALIKSDLDRDQMMAFYHQAENEIKLSIAPYGYFRPTVTSSLKFMGGDRWFAFFRVQPGPIIPIRHLSVILSGHGKNDPTFQKVLADFPLKQGMPFSVKNYDEAKDLLVNLAAQRGYFNAQMTENKLLIDQEPYGADIKLSFNTGARYFFGPLTFCYTQAPKKPLSEAFLHRYVPFKEGDPYDNELLNKLQANLSSSLYFQTVTITPLNDHNHGHAVPMTVKMTAKRSQQYNFGLGFGTDTGIRGLTDINLKPLNTLGHYLSVNAKSSGKKLDNSGEFKVSYNIPGFNPNTDLYKLTAETYHNEDAEIGITNNLKMNASYTNQVWTWEQTLAATLLLERSKPNDEPRKTTTFLIPNGRWIKLKSDDPVSPTKGYRINLSLRGASRATIGTADFFQGYLQAKWLHTFGDSFRVVARGELGLLVTENPDIIPISLRHYAGGSQSVRGYHLNEIGKNDSGRTLSVGSIEIQQRIYHDFYLAAFYDAGEVGSSVFKGYHRGVGGGLVWHSPVGALALTMANALDNPGHPTLVQFSMGPEL
jgi:translocation and assembly module TamA